jgi:hypothetical protein
VLLSFPSLWAGGAAARANGYGFATPNAAASASASPSSSPAAAARWLLEARVDADASWRPVRDGGGVYLMSEYSY